MIFAFIFLYKYDFKAVRSVYTADRDYRKRLKIPLDRFFHIESQIKGANGLSSTACRLTQKKKCFVSLTELQLRRRGYCIFCNITLTKSITDHLEIEDLNM